MRNIHIYPSAFTHESRILKEAGSLLRHTEINEILLLGVYAKHLDSQQTVEPGLTIHRLKPSKGKGKMKALQFPIWLLHVLWFCLKRRPRIVNCHSLWVLPVGVLLKWLTGCRLVYDAHELETETIGTTAKRKRIAVRLEKFCMRWVDLLIVVSPGIEAWYRGLYGANIPAVTALNTPRYQNTRASRRLAEALGLSDGAKIILYQGMLATSRGIEPLLTAAPALKAAGYELVFMGDGPLVEKIREQSKQGSCHWYPAVNPDSLLEYTASAHVGVHPIQGDCLNHQLCLPNKMFEYLMAGLPVLVSNLPEMRRVLEDQKVGVCLDNWTARDILSALQKLQRMRNGDFELRIDQFTKIYNWQRQEIAMLQAYEQYVFKHEHD